MTGRFTPTGVGTIPQRKTADRSATVHPHGRGDNAVIMAQAMSDAGSPPRAWGQCLSDARLYKHSRFTPTGVGTMPRRQTSTSATAVHPHGRGDNAELR